MSQWDREEFCRTSSREMVRHRRIYSLFGLDDEGQPTGPLTPAFYQSEVSAIFKATLFVKKLLNLPFSAEIPIKNAPTGLKNATFVGYHDRWPVMVKEVSEDEIFSIMMRNDLKNMP